MIKSKSQIAQEVGITPDYLNRLCQRLGLWKANDRRRLVSSEEAKTIIDALEGFYAEKQVANVMKSKSQIAEELGIKPDYLNKLCKRFGLWEANDRRKLIGAEEAKTIIETLGSYCAYRQSKKDVQTGETTTNPPEI